MTHRANSHSCEWRERAAAQWPRRRLCQLVVLSFSYFWEEGVNIKRTQRSRIVIIIITQRTHTRMRSSDFSMSRSFDTDDLAPFVTKWWPAWWPSAFW
jgi:hypothetical protein